MTGSHTINFESQHNFNSPGPPIIRRTFYFIHMEPLQPQLAEIQVNYIPFIKPECQPKISSSAEAFQVLKAFYPKETVYVQETFIVLYLNRANRVLGGYKMSQGGLTGTVVDIRLLLSVALKTLSTGLILSHNHPSGNLMPSHADQELTSRIKQACNVMELKLLDHLILTEELYYSFADEGLI
jgi:DNA repair protein RadC